MVKVTIGREGTMHGVKVGGSMGLTTWAAFSGSDDLAAVDGDFIMTAEEVQPVLRALRKAGIHVVALHNHMVGEQPAFYFTHFWGKGKAADLAGSLRAADVQDKAGRGKGHCAIDRASVRRPQSPIQPGDFAPVPGGRMAAARAATVLPPACSPPRPGPRSPCRRPGRPDRTLPITLPAALQLAHARNLDVQVAAERVAAAAAQLDRARSRWLPTVYLGGDYARQEGRIQDIVGNIFNTTKTSVMAGAGPSFVFSPSEAILAPLAARQVVTAREADRRAAENDTTLAVAEAYFNVQRARGELAGAVQAERLRRRPGRPGRELAPAWPSRSRPTGPGPSWPAAARPPRPPASGGRRPSPTSTGWSACPRPPSSSRPSRRTCGSSCSTRRFPSMS